MLLLGAVAEDPENFFRGTGVCEALARRAIVQELRDGSECAQMRLELILRDDEEHDELHRCVIERVELDPAARAAEARDNLIDAIR